VSVQGASALPSGSSPSGQAPTGLDGTRCDPSREELRRQIINTPETANFMAGVPIEAAHQRERWPSDHDAGKTPFDWFWLVGYLAQKAASAAVAGDTEKAKHHTISTAAALANWHASLSGEHTAMRPGIEPPFDDWTCDPCDAANYAIRRKCRLCLKPRSDVERQAKAHGNVA
jgi:hypothetical protein